jgi:hypothetical protein
MIENFYIWGVDNPVDKAVDNSPLFLSSEVIHRLSTGYSQGYPQVIHRVIHRGGCEFLRVMSI